jgi:hypothetical protein
MRKIITHHTNEANRAIAIEADDRDPDNGNASHGYDVTWLDRHGSVMRAEFAFQHGPIAEVGINGITNEVLLAIVIDRLEGFQSGKFANSFNAEALLSVQAALDWLESRTKERESRGVEGTHKP